MNENTERMLRLSHFTLETAADGIYWADAEARIHQVNEATCRMNGYSRDELLTMRAHNICPHLSEEAWKAFWARVKSEKAIILEGLHRTKDGRIFPVEILANYIAFEGEEYVCGFFRDITERQRAQEALQQALAEVERLKNRLQAENLYLQDELKLEHNFADIISRSEAFKKVLRQVEQVAATDATVLILGETGTGKELLARAVHNLSARRDRPLIKVNCAALPASLIESELFGHEKGAFTGAISRKIGRFELADGGTIFLDEIGEPPPELQAKLLRVLQEGEFERLGEHQTIKVDARVIAATNRDLEKEKEAGQFREDLYYRLNVFPIKTPPLRERQEDIALLVHHFVKKCAAKTGKKIETISTEVMAALQAYHWPGNVRELENVIERAVIVSEGKQIALGDWLPRTGSKALSGAAHGTSPIPTLEELEREHVIKVLELTGWRVSGEKGAAKILGLNRTTLEARMKKLGIARRK